ncbi:MAG: hypothetical protein LBV38_04765 [Alistipes sp.]|jgi:nucleoid DNA-binding protein|nr:hypothetical protein [Alistipes sp.]
MVGKLIRDQMHAGTRRLTVPGFGTFMRRSSSNSGNAHGGIGEGPDPKSEEVIFVELLRDDDGVLAELVEDFGGYTEVEAMALIDRFIFETRTNIQRTGTSTIEGFGTLTLDHKGLYRFNHSPQIRPTREQATQERLFTEPPKPVTRQQPKPEEAKPEGPKQAPIRKPAPKPRPTPRPQNQGLTRADIFIIISVVSAIIALAALMFGFSAGNMPFLNNK